MPYLIDGHNLIGQLPDITLDDPDDEARLVQKLTGFVARVRKKCVVVFDAGLPGGASRLSTHQVEVIFASHLSSADKVIIERIEGIHNPQEWTVVSSDGRVIEAARRRKIKTLRSVEFAKLLQTVTPAPHPGIDIAADTRLSDAEINEWLRLFDQNAE